ncbi:Kelch-like protein diablo [Taenia solium]|eukprot:TsM_000996200 transcript=TsM_000996200 gene=TsM_000996200
MFTGELTESKQIKEVVESNEFCLPLTQLVDLPSSDNLCVRGEGQVYQAMIRCLQYDPISRKKQHLLLQHVRLLLLSPTFLTQVVTVNKLIRANKFCCDLVYEAKEYLLLPQERSLLTLGEVLSVVDGWFSGDAIAFVERYDPCSHVWSLLAPKYGQHCGVGVGVITDLLCAVGGHDGQSYLHIMERCDPYSSIWSCDLAPTNICRTSVSVAVFEGFLDADSGWDGVTCLSLVERYYPVTKTLSTCLLAHAKP